MFSRTDTARGRVLDLAEEVGCSRRQLRLCIRSLADDVIGSTLVDNSEAAVYRMVAAVESWRAAVASDLAKGQDVGFFLKEAKKQLFRDAQNFFPKNAPVL